MNIDEILNDVEINKLNHDLLKIKHGIENENLILFGSGNLGRKIAAYFKEKGLPTRLVRFFNTVGPRQVGHYGMVVPRFVSAAVNGSALSVYGDGEQIRCFCHVSDAVRALLLVMDSDKAIGEVFNVGNNEQISIMDLAKKVIAVTGSSSVIEMMDYEKAYPAGFEDMQRRVPDISKIERVLGWKPQIGLEQIIKDIAAHNAGAR